MNIDNFRIQDLLESLQKESVGEKFYPLIPYRDAILRELQEKGILYRDEIADAEMQTLRNEYGDTIANLFKRFLHLYDFNPKKLKDIEKYLGMKEYAVLYDLLRLPGVRLLRAELYYHSGVNIQMLAEQSTEEIQNMVKRYIEENRRSEIVPLKKEVKTHQAVARMILHR